MLSVEAAQLHPPQPFLSVNFGLAALCSVQAYLVMHCGKNASTNSVIPVCGICSVRSNGLRSSCMALMCLVLQVIVFLTQGLHQVGVAV